MTNDQKSQEPELQACPPINLSESVGAIFEDVRREERAAIVAYLRDGDRIGGEPATQLMASVLADYIERGEHHADPTRTNGGVKLDD